MAGKRCQLAIFDFDGTLVDSKDAIAEATNFALEDCGFPKMHPEQITGLVGLPLEYSLRQFLGEAATEETVNKLFLRYRARWLELEPGRLQLFPGMRELLDALKTESIEMAIATSKSLQGLERVMDTLELRAYFGSIVTNDLVTHGKPHPEMVEQILAHFDLPPAQAVMIGDTTYDLQMGKAAGVDTCAVTYGSHSPETLAAESPTYQVNSASELQALLLGKLATP